jgi:hypothetical protein
MFSKEAAALVCVHLLIVYRVSCALEDAFELISFEKSTGSTQLQLKLKENIHILLL